METPDLSEFYTPGHTANTVDFMSRRTLQSHGAFFISCLSDKSHGLDCGCGPGTITCDIAESVGAGRVVGVDVDPSQVDRACKLAASRSIENSEFRQASAYELPFDGNSFDAVFSHALVEYLAHPPVAIAEFRRVLLTGGFLGICSPDWGGFLLSPPSDALTSAIEAYNELQTRQSAPPPNVSVTHPTGCPGRLRGLPVPL